MLARIYTNYVPRLFNNSFISQLTLIRSLTVAAARTKPNNNSNNSSTISKSKTSTPKNPTSLKPTTKQLKSPVKATIEEHIDNTNELNDSNSISGWKIDQTILPKPAPLFKDLNISSYLYNKLNSLNFLRPTLIQTAAIPHLLRRPYNSISFPDVIIQDLTGQGKTLAYLLPILSTIDNYLPQLQTLIVVPTRELAVQINNVIDELLLGAKKNRALNPIKSHLLIGDVNPSMISELTRLNEKIETRPHIIIGTANPINELLLQSKLMDIKHLKYMVFDEIDNLLTRGDSRPYIIPIIQSRPKLDPNINEKSDNQLIINQPRTQIVFVSATITPAVLDLAAIHLSNNRKLITPASIPDECKRRGRPLNAKIPQRLKHYYIVSDRPYARHQLLLNLLVAVRKQYEQSIAYDIKLKQKFLKNSNNTISKSKSQLKPTITSTADLLAQTTAIFFNKHEHIPPHINPINQLGFNLGLLTEHSSRSERRDALKPGINQTLLCTDIFSRGMDLKPLTHIINYDLPNNENVYLHRAGRVGRLSSLHARTASIMTFIEPNNTQHIEKLKQFQQKLNIPKITRIYLRNGTIYQANDKSALLLNNNTTDNSARKQNNSNNYLYNLLGESDVEETNAGDSVLEFTDEDVEERAQSEFQ